MHIDPIRVFWVPGCSACVKAKEFLTGLGVPFESVNLLDNEQGAADLAKLGARSLPVVARGDKFVFAQSLDQVAEFVGRKNTADNRLPPDELVRRWTEFLVIARSLILDIPAGKLDHQPIPNRKRDLRELAYHIFQVPDVFVRNVAGEFEDWAYHVNLPVPQDVCSTAEIVNFAEQVTGNLTDWWDALADRSCRWTVKTYYGVRPGWELLERQTWHSAQHIRQLQAVLEGFGVKMQRSVPPELYDGLPMPVGLWE
jgi:glutaredoxin